MLDPTIPAVSRDDAEALVSIMRTANSSKGGVVLRYGDAARAILAAGFRRPSVSGDNVELIAWNRSMAEWERENGSQENAAQHDVCAVALSTSQPREVEITDDKRLLAFRLRKVAARISEGNSDHQLFLDAAAALGGGE